MLFNVYNIRHMHMGHSACLAFCLFIRLSRPIFSTSRAFTIAGISVTCIKEDTNWTVL